MIKVGFLVSYDYKYLFKSIPCIYDYADLIVLAIDKDRVTWSGNPISISEDFFSWIKEIDVNNKIKIYEDHFYVSTNTPAENDTRERNLLALAMGEGGWHIQLDSDEYFVNFKEFTEYLNSLDKKYLLSPKKFPIEIHALWITLYKKVNGGYLYIKDAFDSIEVATNYPQYKYMRITNHKKKVISKFYMLHQSWARDEIEVITKFNNWGHKGDATNKKAFEIWKNLTLENYKEFKNFHASDPEKWKSLEYVKEEDISTLKIEITNSQISKMKFKKNVGNYIRENLPVPVQNVLKSFYRFLTGLKK